MYWTEVGIRIYHELLKQDRLFWDATGSVVQKCNGADVLETWLAIYWKYGSLRGTQRSTTIKGLADMK